MSFGYSRGKVVFLHDMIMASLSIPLALYLRLGDDFFEFFASSYVLKLSLIFTVVAAFIFRFMRMYWGVWRYASLNDLATIIKAVTLLELVFIAALFLINRMDSYPRSALIINWFVLIAMLGGPRFLYRLFKDKRYELKFEKQQTERIPVLLHSVGNETDWFIRAVQTGAASSYKIVGIIARKERVGQEIRGVKILGTDEDFNQVIKDLSKKGQQPQKLILTRDDLDGETTKQLFDMSAAHGMTLARLPKADALRSGLGDKIEVHPIDIEDLLRRPQRVLDRDSMRALIEGRRVMVTGAGGSIGSELVRQVAALKPSHITLIENSEFNLYSIDMELSNKFPDISKTPLIADVRNRNRMSFILKEQKPELLFHAAALKHVPMTEINPVEGISTNVIGTRIVADCCRENNVRTMVMISTDKAVNPTNVMGATKRLAECYCQALDLSEVSNKKLENATRYVTVRFGNVLGSTGSVVPLFQKQLANGGPLTVTHPDVNRYFMTIREAVELVLQASALGSRKRTTKHEDEPEYHGKIFVLEMGEPVKIVDLAKQIIRLAGFRPEVDVAIEFTGLRAGEKLFEEIFHGKEPLIPTICKGILLAEPRPIDLKAISKAFNEMEKYCSELDSKKALNLLHELVPEFKSQ